MLSPNAGTLAIPETGPRGYRLNKEFATALGSSLPGGGPLPRVQTWNSSGFTFLPYKKETSMPEISETVFVSRPHLPGCRSEVWVTSPSDKSQKLIFTTDEMLLEAPNWTRDGTALILNGAGAMWRLDLCSGSIEELSTAGIPQANNDHVLDPTQDRIYLSANDGHIHRVGLDGRDPARITSEDGHFHFLHGVSPDGQELAYVAIEDCDFSTPGQIRTMSANGGPSVLIEVGQGHCDGPEYSPDGRWIYLNTETFSTKPGHAQIARIRGDGTCLERLTQSDTVDWFPHLSPDGQRANYLRYPPGTTGHPADVGVEIVTVSVRDWNTPLHSIDLLGGQGSLNVNSWSPDSSHFAYVAYSPSGRHTPSSAGNRP